MAKKEATYTLKIDAELGNLQQKLGKVRESLDSVFASGEAPKGLEKAFDKVNALLGQIYDKSGKALNVKELASAGKDLGAVQDGLRKIVRLMGDFDSLSDNLKFSFLSDDEKQKFADVTAEIKKYGQFVELTTKKVKELENAQKKLEKSKETVEKAQKAVGTLKGKKEKKAVELSGTKSKLAAAEGAENVNPEKVAKLRADIVRLRNEITGLDGEIKSANEKLSAANANYTQASQSVDELTRAAQNASENGLNTLKDKAVALGVSLEGLDGKTPAEQIEILEQRMSELSQEILKGAEPAFKKFQKGCNDSGKGAENLRQKVEEVREETDAQNRAMQEQEAIENKIKQFIGLAGASHILKAALRDAMQTITELDETMTEMAVVTDLTVGDYWDQLPEYSKRATELGVSINSAYKAATLYYQQGLKTNEVNAISTETLKMAKIAGLDAAEATDKMTAALRGFNMELNETSAKRVADVYSELAAITAADVNEISSAMTKTASIASSAGMEFETTAAFLSQIIETTRESAETAGTALKTVIARFQELKKAPGEIGEIDGEIVDANAIEKALRSVGVSLRDSSGQFRELDEVFLELSSKWDTLDKNTQRYIATIAAGSRQQSRFIAMMSDYARTQELVSAANNSAGASQKQFEKTMESLSAKIEKLKNAWHEFTMGIMDSELVKTGVDILTKFLEIINKATSGIGGLADSLTKVVSILAIFKMGKKIFEAFKPIILEVIQEWKNLFEGGAYEAGVSYGKGFKAGLKSELQDATHPKPGTGEKTEKTPQDNKQEEIKPTWVPKGYTRDDNGRIHDSTGKFVNKDTSDRINKQAQLVQDAQSVSGVDKLKAGLNALKNVGDSRKNLAKKKQDLDKLKEEKAQRQSEKKSTKAVDNKIKKAEQDVKDLTKAQKEAEETGETAWSTISAGAAKFGSAVTAAGVATSMFGGALESMGLEKFGGAISKLGQGMTILGTIISSVVTVLSKIPAILSVITAHPIVAIITVVLATVLVSILAINAALQKISPEARLEEAAEAAERASEAADQAADSFNNLVDSLEGLDDKYEALDELTRGTKEWNNAVINLNNDVLDLIDRYPELASLVKNEGGVLTLDINSDEVQAVISKAQANMIVAKNTEHLANANVADAEQQVAFGNLTAIEKVGTRRGWERVGDDTLKGASAGAGVGSTVGAFLGAVEGAVDPITPMFISSLAGRVVGAGFGGAAGAIIGAVEGSIAAPFAAAKTKLDEELEESVIALGKAIQEGAVNENYDDMYAYLTETLDVAADEAKILAREFSEDTNALRDFTNVVRSVEAREEAAYSAIAASAQSLLAIGKYNENQMAQMRSIVNADILKGYQSGNRQEYEDMSKKELENAKLEYAKTLGSDARVEDNKIIYKDADGKEQTREFKSDDEWFDALATMKTTQEAAKMMEQVPEMLTKSTQALNQELGDNIGNTFAKAITTEAGLTKGETDKLKEKIDNSALEKAWSNLSEEQKAIYEGDFLKYVESFEDALEKNTQAFALAEKNANKLGITLNDKLSAKAAENWTKQLNELSLGGVDVSAFNDAVNSALEGLTIEQTELFMSQLNDVDFSSIDSWDAFEKLVQDFDLPVKDLEGFVDQAKELSNAIKKVDFDSLNKQLQNTYQLIEKIEEKSSRTFTEEEYKELISANRDLEGAFTQVGDKYIYIGGKMDTLTEALEENALATANAARNQLDFLVAAGTVISENLGESGDVANMDTAQLQDYLTESADLLKAEGIDLSLFGETGLTNTTDFSTITDTELLRQWAQVIQSTGNNLEYNQQERTKTVEASNILTYTTQNTAKQNAEFVAQGGDQMDEHAKALLTQAAMSGGVSDSLIAAYEQALNAATAPDATEEDKAALTSLGNTIAERITETLEDNENREAYTDLVTRISEAIYDSKKEEIDKLSDINESVNDAQTKVVSKIQDQINEERQRRENEKAEKNLDNLQQQKAYLAMQTGGNPLEMLKLDEQIETAEQEYQDTLIDQALQELSDANEKAAEQRERQIELMERQLEAEKDRGDIANKAAEIARTSVDDIKRGVNPLETAMGKILWKSEGKGLGGLEKEAWVSQLNQTAVIAEKYLTKEEKDKSKPGISFGGLTFTPPTFGPGADIPVADLTNPDADTVLTEWQKIQQMFMKFFNEDIPNWWNNNLAPYFSGEFWGNLWSNISQWWSSTVAPIFTSEFWGNMFSPVATWWNETIVPFFTAEYWSGLFAPVVEWWNTTIVPVFDRKFWDDLFSPVAGWWDETIAPIFSAEYWDALWQQIVGWWKTNIAPIFTAEFWQDLWNNVVEWYNKEVAQIFTLEFWSEKFYQAGVAFGNFILQVGELLKELGIKLGSMWEEIETWWEETVVAWWNKNIAHIFTKEFWIQKGEEIKQGLIDVWNSIVEFFTVSIPEWYVNNIQKYFTKDFWIEQGQKILEGLKQTWNAIAEFFTQTIPEWLDTTFGKYFTKEFWQEKWEGFVSAIEDTLITIDSWLLSIGLAVVQGAQYIIETVSGAINSVFTSIVEWFEKNISPIFTKEFWEEKWNNIKTAFDGAIQAFSDAMTAFENGLMSLLTGIYETITTIVYIIGGAIYLGFSAVVDWFKETLLPMFTKEYWAEKWENFTDALKAAWEGFLSWWDTDIKPMFTKEYWENLWEEIKTAFSTKLVEIEGLMETVFSSIKTWWDENIAKLFTKEYWEGVWKTLSESVTSVVQEIDKTLTGVFKGIAGSVVSAFETAINAAINGINGAMKSIASIYNATLGSFLKGVASVLGWDQSKFQFNYTEIKPVKFEAPKYEQGGLANFTGPAWLDGTPSKPEYVLNADQTERFFALVDVLEGLDTDSAPERPGGDNYFDISINVDKIDSDYDVEQIADKIRSIIYDDATYRNVNAVNLIR